MKRGSTGIVVLVSVVAVLALGLVYVLTDNSSPTGYAGSPTGGITAFVPQYTPCSSDADCTPPETCQYYEEYDGYYCGVNGECDTGDHDDCIGQVTCESPEVPTCDSNECVCDDPCGEGENCGDCACGGTCEPNTPDAEGPFDFICDPGNDGCAETGECSLEGFLASFSVSFVNPCGPNAHCVLTDGSNGQCVCGSKGCEFTDDDDKDACPGTVKCDEGKSCTTGSQCGGPSAGACIGGECDCDCVSWAPCQEDDDCGAGECVTGEDGSFECMCASEFGCSFDQCEPGVTPCDDSDDCFGGGCKTSGEAGVCEECGISCNIDCSGNGDCPEEPSQADCNAVGAAFGGASCVVDSDCDCILPSNACTDCVEIDGVFWCVD